MQCLLILDRCRSVEAEEGQRSFVGAEGCHRESGGDVGGSAARRWLMAKLRRVAMFSDPCPVRILEASSRKAASRTKWSLFSITRCALKIISRRSGDAWRLVRPVITYTVSRLCLPVRGSVRWRTTRAAWAAWGKSTPRPVTVSQHLHDPGLLAAVSLGAVVALRCRLRPGQGPHLLVEVLLVPLHGEGVVRAADGWAT